VAGVRRASAQDAMLSILKKLEGMLDSTNESYEKQITILSSTEAVMKNNVAVELKKQTGILTSIEAKIGNLSAGSIGSVKDSGLGAALGGIPEALKDLVKMLGIAGIFGPIIEEGAESLARSIKILLESSKGVDTSTALTSVSFFALITASKLNALIGVLSKSLGIRGILGFGLGNMAKAVATSVRTLLTILEPQAGGIFGIGADPRRISPSSALSSVLAINLLSSSKISQLFEILGKGSSLWGSIVGMFKPNAEKQLANAIRSLLMISMYSKDQEKDGYGKVGQQIPNEVVIKSIFAIGLLSSAKIKELTNALKPAFGGIFGSGAKGMQSRAKGLASAVRSLLTVSQGIDTGTMIKSVFAIGILSYSVDTLISALRRAAIWNPFILLGIKVTSKAISTLLASVNAVKEGGDLLGAAAYLVALSFSIGALITATIVAAFLAPLIIIGSLSLKFMISSIVGIKNSMDKNGIDEKFIEKISLVVVAVGAIIGVAMLIANFSTANPITTIIGNVIMLGVMSFLVVKMTTTIAKQISSEEGKLKAIDLVAIAATSLINAITLIILSKAMQDPPGSIKNLLLFGFMQLILVGSIYLVIKAISNANMSTKTLLAYNVFILGMVLTTMLAILFVRTVGAAGIGDIILFGLMIAVISFSAIFFAKRLSKASDDMIKAVKALVIWTLGILIVGAGVVAFATFVPPVAVLYTVLAISAIAFVAYMIGENNKEINDGSWAIAGIGLAIVVFSIGLFVFKMTKMEFMDVIILGVAVGGLAFIMYQAGIASVDIKSGAISMIIAGVSLILISAALLVFKKANFGWEDAGILGAVVGGLGLAMATAGTIGFPWIAIGAGQMLIAGAALYLITSSLKTFKDSKFTMADADNLEYAVGSVVKAFSIVTDTDRQKKMGFQVDPWDLFWGIEALSGAGRVLAGLAAGIQAWANLEVNEWEVINAGTKDAKLVIKGRRKLTQTDFDNAAFGMGRVISAIAEPFAKVGKLEQGESSGDPFYDMIFGGGFVSSGIDALARSGETLVNLAKGVQAWANLEITEYEVVGSGTKDAKLVPKSVRKMNPADFAMASLNIGMVVGFIAKEFAKIGLMEKNTEGIFADGIVKKGIDSISGLGNNLLSIAEVITKMANMEIVENEVKIIDGRPQIVAKSVRKITPAEMAKASVSIGLVTGFLASEIAKIGKMEADSEGWFANGNVKKGVDAIAGLGQNVLSMADAIIKLANTEITEYKIDEKGQLVPVSTRKMQQGDFIKASETLSKILGIVFNAVVDFGSKVEANEEKIKKATAILPGMTDALANAAKPIEAWSKLKDTEKVSGSIVNFMNTLKAIFDPSTNPTIADSSKYFTVFAYNIEKMASPNNALDKAAANIDKIEKSMKLLKDSINAMDLKKLTLTDSLMKSLAILSKNPEAVAKAIEGSIDKSFKELVDAIKEIAKVSSAASNPVATSTAPSAPAAKGGTPTKNAPVAQSQQSADSVAKTLSSALAGLTLNVKVTNVAEFPK
jgi:hypothetical protein